MSRRKFDVTMMLFLLAKCSWWRVPSQFFPRENISIFTAMHENIDVFETSVMRGLDSQRSAWGNIASCQLSSTFVLRHRDCPQKTVPTMSGPRRHWTTEMNRTVQPFWHIEGILPKGPYLPCVSMAGRALLAGYHRYVLFPWSLKGEMGMLAVQHQTQGWF